MSGRLTAPFAHRIRLNCAVRAIRRSAGRRCDRRSRRRTAIRYDHVVIAAHADQALAMLADPSAAEDTLLGAIGQTRNEAVMHRDPALMPRRRAVWASWNYIGAARAMRSAPPTG